MNGVTESGCYRDDGTRIDVEQIAKPGLCEGCRMDGNPDEVTLCLLTRADQEDAEDFLCAAYQPKS